jgi:hypothetical protein
MINILRHDFQQLGRSCALFMVGKCSLHSKFEIKCVKRGALKCSNWPTGRDLAGGGVKNTGHFMIFLPFSYTSFLFFESGRKSIISFIGDIPAGVGRTSYSR